MQLHLQLKQSANATEEKAHEGFCNRQRIFFKYGATYFI